jgi:ankyrin repeat protein
MKANNFDEIEKADKSGNHLEVRNQLVKVLHNYFIERSRVSSRAKAFFSSDTTIITERQAATQLLKVILGQAGEATLIEHMGTYAKDPLLKKAYDYCTQYSWWHGVDLSQQKEPFKIILSLLDIDDLARASAVSKTWQISVAKTNLWERALQRNFPHIYGELKKEEAGQTPQYDRRYPDWQRPWSQKQWKQAYRDAQGNQLSQLNLQQKKLFKAIKNRHATVLAKFVIHWPDLWACETRGKTSFEGRNLLGLVLDYQQLPWLRSLYSQQILLRPGYQLDDTVNVAGVDENSATLLHWAVATQQDATVIAELMRNGCPVNSLAFNVSISNPKVQQGRTALYIASEMGDVERVSVLLQNQETLVNETNQFIQASALSIACKYGHEQVVEVLLTHALVNVNQPDRGGYTPLMNAIRRGHVSVVKLLLKRPNVEVDVVDADGRTALHHACEQDDPEMVQLLLDMKLINVNPTEHYQDSTPLHRATSHGNVAQVKLLLNDKRTEPDTPNSDNESAFVVACKAGNLDMVKAMLEHREGINFNHVGKHGTGLSWACRMNNFDMLTALLAEPQRVDINHVDEQLESVLHESCDQSRLSSVIALLTRKDIALNPQNNRGETPLYQACQLNRVSPDVEESNAIISLLLARENILTNLADQNGVTPLHIACVTKYPQAVQLLLTRSETDVNQPDNYGETPLASICGYMREDELLDRAKVLKILLACPQTKVNQANENDETPLHIACRYGQLEVVEALLAHPDILLDLKDANGVTPLAVAAKNNDPKVVEALEKKGAEIAATLLVQQQGKLL